MALLEGSLRVTGTVTAGLFAGLREEVRIVGNGSVSRFSIVHGLGTKLIFPLLYDAEGRIVFAAWQCLSENTAEVSFFYPPLAGEVFTAVLRK